MAQPPIRIVTTLACDTRCRRRVVRQRQELLATQRVERGRNMRTRRTQGNRASLIRTLPPSLGRCCVEQHVEEVLLMARKRDTRNAAALAERAATRRPPCSHTHQVEGRLVPPDWRRALRPDLRLVVKEHDDAAPVGCANRVMSRTSRRSIRRPLLRAPHICGAAPRSRRRTIIGTKLRQCHARCGHEAADNSLRARPDDSVTLSSAGAIANAFTRIVGPV